MTLCGYSKNLHEYDYFKKQLNEILVDFFNNSSPTKKEFKNLSKKKKKIVNYLYKRKIAFPNSAITSYQYSTLLRFLEQYRIDTTITYTEFDYFKSQLKYLKYYIKKINHKNGFDESSIEEGLKYCIEYFENIEEYEEQKISEVIGNRLTASLYSNIMPTYNGKEIEIYLFVVNSLDSDTIVHGYNIFYCPSNSPKINKDKIMFPYITSPSFVLRRTHPYNGEILIWQEKSSKKFSNICRINPDENILNQNIGLKLNSQENINYALNILKITIFDDNTNFIQFDDSLINLIRPIIEKQKGISYFKYNLIVSYLEQ